MIKPIQQAESLYDQKKYTESIEIALYSIKEGEEILRSYKIIAKANKEMKRNEEAIDYMLKVVSITPNDYECYKDLGNMYLILNQNDLAKEAYETSLDKKSNYYPSLGNLGIIYFIDGNYERSIYYLLKAIKSNPQFAEAWVNLSNCYLKQGKLIEAKESALISVKLRYDWDKVHQILAIVYCELR